MSIRNLWRRMRELMFVGKVAFIGIAAFLCYAAWRALVPAEWEFSIETETEIAELGLETTTQWQIDGVVLCTRGSLDLDANYRLDQADSPCGSRAWQAWQVPEPEQILEFSQAVSSSLSMRPEGGLAISIRATEGPSVGTYSVVGIVEDVALGDAVNLIWPVIPTKALTLPFAGPTTLGRSVGWSNFGMLRSGNVSIYTADESADKRSLVDSTNLMLGDQIRMGDNDRRETWPKGFARIMPGDNFMRIVAFGRADRLRIERFGESGYDLKPGRLRKLASDPSVAFYGSLLLALLSIMFGLQQFLDTNEDAESQRASSRFRGKGPDEEE